MQDNEQTIYHFMGVKLYKWFGMKIEEGQYDKVCAGFVLGLCCLLTTGLSEDILCHV